MGSGVPRGGSGSIESGFAMVTCRRGWRGGLWGLVLELVVFGCTAAHETLLGQRRRVRALVDVRDLLLRPRVLGGIGWGFA